MLRILTIALLTALTLNVNTSFAGGATVSIAELTSQLRTLTVDSQRGDAAARTSALRTLTSAAAAREQQLAAMIADHPDVVLRHAVSAQTRATLPPEVQAYVEENVALDGTLEVQYEDGPTSRLHYFLNHARGRLALHFAADAPERLQTGDQVHVAGLRVQQSLALSSGTAQVTVLALAAMTTFGPQNTAVIVVRFQDRPTETSVTPAQAREIMFGTSSPTSVTNFYREASYGQTWFTGDVYGPYTVPVTSTTCDTANIAKYGKQAATAQVGAAVMATYTRFVYAFPPNTCGWWGLGNLGGSPTNAWVKGPFLSSVISHELGHNLGVYHSHALACGGTTLGVIGVDCASVEYGDELDVMGAPATPLHFNAAQKGWLGWLDYGDSPPITTVQASGVYTLDPYESAGDRPKALRVATPSGDWYYVEYRQAVGFDAPIDAANPGVTNGVVLHTASRGNGNGIYLLLATPFDWTNPALGVGEVFTDPAAGITIALVWANNTAGVSVTLAGGGPSCVRQDPTTVIAPAKQQGPAGTKLSYNLSVTNHDSDCPASTFTTQATHPAGAWVVSFAPSALSIAAGQTVTTTMQVTSPSAVAAGAYTISPVVADGAAQSSPAPALYTVTTGGGASFTDAFTRADSDTLGNGWTPVSGALMIRSTLATNSPVKSMHTAVRAGLVGPTQTVTAQFTSTSSNLGPRFGLLLRYQDPQNYYLCYRQTGGSSVLRISRVVNGVEKILKAVAVKGPMPETPFTLACRVEAGPTPGTSLLTLTLDGATPVTVSDSTLATGSVGFGMGYPKGGLGTPASHRASSFSAIVQ